MHNGLTAIRRVQSMVANDEDDSNTKHHVCVNCHISVSRMFEPFPTWHAPSLFSYIITVVFEHIFSEAVV